MDKLKQVEQVLLFYFGGERQTKEGCSQELATFLSQKIAELFQGQTLFLDETFRKADE